jgi:CHAT domain-containing protein
MDGNDFLQELFATDNPAEQKRCLSRNLEMANVIEAATRLKEQADHYLRGNLQWSLDTCELLYELAEKSDDPVPRALGFLAEANARAIGMGEYEAALSLYDQGAEIYESLGLHIQQASAQIGKIGTLMFLGRYEEALKIGSWAIGILENVEAWFPLAKINSNMSVVYYQLGDDRRALEMLGQSQKMYEKAGKGDSPDWMRTELNRAIVLRNLGEFEASIHSSLRASQMLLEAGQTVEAARAQQSLAQTYFILGRNNEALQILEDVREAFLADNRMRDAALVELYRTDILLQLRRFSKVLENCTRMRQIFNDLGTRYEFSLAVVDEALAFAGLKQYDAALASLNEAKALFEEQGNRSWTAYADLERAEVYLKLKQPEKALQIAQGCTAQLKDQPLKRSQACLIAASAMLETGDIVQAEILLRDSLQNENQIVPALNYACRHLLAKIAQKQGDFRRALDEFDQAIRGLEQWRSRMMVEFRASFLEDKQVLYDDVITMCVENGQPEKAFSFAERAKSQSLLEMLENRISLRIASLSPDDEQLIQELVRLREERDRLYRRWESDSREEMRLRGNPDCQQGLITLHQEIGEIEENITELWHKLLVRNADYARETSLWQVQTENIRPYLDEETLLLKYYFAHGDLYAFLVWRDSLNACRLPVSRGEVERCLELLWLNLKTVIKSPVEKRSELTSNVKQILEKLYRLLISPVEQEVSRCKNIIIVPHGPLHYLPFHALYDGRRYLVGKHTISYLPAASFLKFCQAKTSEKKGLLAAGHSNNGALPDVVEEAKAVASLWASTPLLEEQVTRENIQKRTADCRAVHIAAHGEFRSDNPLFSGLALEDGWLTTLDVFDWELNASLVVLSACETGRSVVGGGDELLGLMRAFLYAGASTLVLSQWAVEDQAASLLMQRFYSNLSKGCTKGEALQMAQLSFIEDGADQALAHPYFWAPFMLIGHSGSF